MKISELIIEKVESGQISNDELVQIRKAFLIMQRPITSVTMGSKKLEKLSFCLGRNS